MFLEWKDLVRILSLNLISCFLKWLFDFLNVFLSFPSDFLLSRSSRPPFPRCPSSSPDVWAFAQCACFSQFDCHLLAVHCGMISGHPGWKEKMCLEPCCNMITYLVVMFGRKDKIVQPQHWVEKYPVDLLTEKAQIIRKTLLVLSYKYNDSGNIQMRLYFMNFHEIIKFPWVMPI